MIEMVLSAALAYGSYLLADAIGASGALACVAAGLVYGSYGRRVGMSSDTSRVLDDLWEFQGFVANAILFLLIGFSVDLAAVGAEPQAVIAAIIAVLVARILVVDAVRLATTRGRHAHSRIEPVVRLWAGIRGALTIALALGLPPQTPARSLLIAMTFGVVLFTLIVQGLTLAPMIRAVRSVRRDRPSRQPHRHQQPHPPQALGSPSRRPGRQLSTAPSQGARTIVADPGAQPLAAEDRATLTRAVPVTAAAGDPPRRRVQERREATPASGDGRRSVVAPPDHGPKPQSQAKRRDHRRGERDPARRTSPAEGELDGEMA
jgi:NhaP-type Na+/H+ or K+/H+ antiporter